MRRAQRGHATWEEVVSVLLAASILTVITLGVLWWVNRSTCHNRWDSAGFQKVEYRLLAGCMVQRKDGSWIPTSAVRDLGP